MSQLEDKGVLRQGCCKSQKALEARTT